MKSKQIRYLEDVVSLAGGTTKLGALLGIHAQTVENWRRSGIPIRYWDKLHDLYGITPAELFSLTKACRKSVKGD